MLDHAYLYPGAMETLVYLKDREQAVVTNKPNPYSEDILKALEVLDYFFKVVPGNSSFPRKPRPESVGELMKMKGIENNSEVLMLGDSLIDLEYARKAGIDCVLFTHGFTPLDRLQSASPEWLLDGFKSFLSLVKERKW